MAEAQAAVRHWYKRTGLRRFVRQQRTELLYLSALAARRGVRAASLPRALALADRAGDLAYAAFPGLRRLVFDHLAIALGQTHSPAARAAIARQAYRNTARSVVELAKLDDIRPRFEEYVAVDGWEHVEAVRALDRGAIVVSGHIGNYDLFAAYMVHRGINFAAVAKTFHHRRLNRLITEFRTSNGLQVILRGTPATSREIVKLLKQRGVLALQIDNDIGVPSVSVPFFDRMTRTPVAAAALSVRRGIPIVPAFARRRPDGGHLFTILPPILPPARGDRRRDVIELTSQFSRILEDYIRRYPEEWNWWHRRWRRAPMPHMDLDAASPPMAASA